MIQRLKLLVLPEDTGANGFATVKTIVRKLLEYLQPGVPLWADEGREHEWIAPRRSEEFALMGAAAWKVEKPIRPADIEKKRALQRAIVTHLLLHEPIGDRREPVGFVFFHHDGDAAWSAHDGCTLCSQFVTFRNELEQNVRAQLDRDARVPLDQKDLEADRAMRRLIPVQPHWCVESWLVGQSRLAAELCSAHHPGRTCDASWWQCERHLLEERPYPKQRCCLHDDHNATLAKAFNAEAAYGASPSFTALVDAAMNCDDLATALRDVAAAGR